MGLIVDSKELRIGNWLNYPFIGKSQIRHGTDIDNVYGDGGMGIPLTPEILEACGFDGNKFLSVGDQTIQIVQNEFCLAGIDSPTSGQCFIGKIEYLHQLQNLYYSLTGKELTYTPVTEKA